MAPEMGKRGGGGGGMIEIREVIPLTPLCPFTGAIHIL